MTGTSSDLPQVTGPKTPTGPVADVYARLLASTRHPAKRRTLERIWGALEALRAAAERQKRPRSYTQADVLKYLKEAGTPIGATTIQNPGQGDDFRALIATYAEEYGSRREQEDPHDDDTLPLHIKDPALQHRIRVVLHQNRTLKDRNILLHKNYQRLVQEAAQQALPAPARSALPPGIDAREVAAVRHFLETAVPGLRWTVDEGSGAVLDRHGDEVAPPGFVHALRRVAGL